MGKKLKACRHVIATLFLFWLAFMLLGTILTTFKPLPLLKNSITLTGFVAFVISAFFFHRHRFTIIYVFGHELTHWATAKLFQETEASSSSMCGYLVRSARYSARVPTP